MNFGLSKDVYDSVVKVNYTKEMMLCNKNDKDAEGINFLYQSLNKVLCSTDMLKGCPPYLGQRTKHQNIELVKTTFAIFMQQLLTQDDVILLLDCFRTQCKSNNDKFKLGALKGNYISSRYTVPENVC